MSIYEQASKPFSEVIMPFKAALSRHWKLAWAPALVVLGLVTFAGLRLPDYFKSDVLIYIQQQKVTSKIIDAPTREDQTERLESLIYEMLSRSRLRSIIERFELYPEYSGVIGTEKALRKFREAMVITPVASQAGKQLLQTFKLEFTHEDPRIAFEVTKALSNLFIEESILSTRSETQGTEEFLDGQLRAARQKLESTEAKVQAFVRENFGKLPEHLNAGIARLENAQAQLASNSQLMTANVTRLSSLRQELGLAEREITPGTLSSSRDDASANPQESLAQLESALVVLRSRFTDQHPDVISTQKRIEALRSRLKSSGGQGKASVAVPSGRGGNSTEARRIRLEIGEVESQVAALKQENEHLKKTIESLEADIKEMPLKEQELIKINRDYANVKANYERLSQARQEASLQSSLVSSQKGAQFRIVEPPALPAIPAGPNRLLIIGAGLLASLVVFLAVPLVLFFLNSSYKFRDELESELGIPVMAVVPPMNTPRAAALYRRAASASLLASLLTFICGSALILLIL